MKKLFTFFILAFIISAGKTYAQNTVTYGMADFNPRPDLSGVIYSSSDTNVVSVVANKLHIKKAGSTTISGKIGGGTQSQLLTVNKATLTITADNKTKFYSSENPALTASYSGFVYGDTPAKLTTPVTLSTTASTLSSPGNYPITASGAASPNYNIVYVAGTLAVNPFPPVTYGIGDFDPKPDMAGIVYTSSNAAVATIVANKIHVVGAGSTVIQAKIGPTTISQTLIVNKATLTITADNKTKFYSSENPALTASYSGFVYGDTPAKLTTPVTLSTTASTLSSAGTYPITASGAASPNYNIVYVAGTLAVNPFPPVTYGIGDFDPKPDMAGIVYTSSNAAVATIVANKIHVVGAGSTLIQAKIGGTTISQTLVVNKATLTVTAGNASRTAGAANPTFSVNYTGFVNGDGVANLDTLARAGTTANPASPAGTYPINPYGAAAKNYKFTYVPGNLTVTAPTTLNINIIAGQPKVPGSTGDGGMASLSTLNSPYAMVIDIRGNIYIAAYGDSKVRMIDANTQIITTIAGTGTAGYSGDGGLAVNAQLNLGLCGLAVDTAGNVYIGDDKNNRVRKIDAKTKIITTIAGTGVAGYSGDGGQATAAKLNGPNGIAVDRFGNICVADFNNGAIRKINVNTKVITTLITNIYGERLTFDKLGNYLYVADGGVSRIKKINAYSGATQIIAGTGAYGNTGDGGSAINAQFKGPIDVALDANDNIYIADQGAGTVRKINASNNIISTVAGTGVNGYSGDGGPADTTKLNFLSAIAIDPAGNILICDLGNQLIRKVGVAVLQTMSFPPFATKKSDKGDFDPGATASSGLPITYTSSNPAVATIVNGKIHLIGPGTTTILARQNGNLSYSPVSASQTLPVISSTVTTDKIYTIIGGGMSPNDGVEATSTKLIVPYAMVKDSKGNIYVAGNDNRIRKVNASSKIITTFAGVDTAGFAGDGGLATNARFRFAGNLIGLGIDAADNIYVGDAGNQRVRKIDANTNVITTVAGNGVAGNAGDGGLATAANLNYPGGIAVDIAGNIYISDLYNGLVRKIDVNTKKISTYISGGYGSNVPAVTTAISSIERMTIDHAGNMYVGDAGNGLIRKINLANNSVTTIAGNGTYGYSGDGGPATSAQISNPMGIAIDTAGNIYFSDQANNAIRRIDKATGIITTITGNGIRGYTGDNGFANLAQLAFPTDISLDSEGGIYICDYANSVVRKVGASKEIKGLSVANVNQLAVNTQSTGISIYPNPFVSTVKIDLSKYDAKYAGVQVRDLQGAAVFTDSKLAISQGVAEVNLSNLNNGIYIINVDVNAEHKSYKIIKQ